MKQAAPRIKIHLIDKHLPDFEIEGFPCIPSAGDNIKLTDIVEESELKKHFKLDLVENIIECIDKYSWNIEWLNWSRDADGIFAQLYCNGE